MIIFFFLFQRPISKMCRHR